MNKYRFAAGTLAAVSIVAASALFGVSVGNVRAQMNGGQHGPMGPHGQGHQGPMGSGSGPGMSMDMARHFIEEMIPHHEDAVVMADLALSQAEHQELHSLAENIKRVQTDEIALMRQWYQDWYGTTVPASSMGGAMPGMAGHDPRAIDGAQPFDRAFIEEMIPHHQMAVMMSTMAEHGVTQPELLALLASIRTSQSAEIQLMQTWSSDWYGVSVSTAELMPEHGMSGAEHHGIPHGTGMEGNGHGADGLTIQPSIRSLSSSEVQQIRNGEGAGLARAAEMNGLPGPRHILDAADQLGLSAEQAAQIQLVFNTMHGAAVEAGAAYLNAQEVFEGDLRTGQVTIETLPQRLTAVDQLRTELTRVHLEAHLQTAALLTGSQREQYGEIRGH